MATIYRRVPPNIWRSSVRNLLLVTLLALRIIRWLIFLIVRPPHPPQNFLSHGKLAKTNTILLRIQRKSNTGKECYNTQTGCVKNEFLSDKNKIQYPPHIRLPVNRYIERENGLINVQESFLFQPSNAQIYNTTVSLYIMHTPTCFDISLSS